MKETKLKDQYTISLLIICILIVVLCTTRSVQRSVCLTRNATSDRHDRLTPAFLRFAEWAFYMIKDWVHYLILSYSFFFTEILKSIMSILNRFRRVWYRFPGRWSQSKSRSNETILKGHLCRNLEPPAFYSW